MRIDGFVSLHAGRVVGELLSKPFELAEPGMSLNFATSAAGAVRLELIAAEGGAVLARSEEMFGDAIDRQVPWQDGGRRSAWVGRPVRLRIMLREADLYSLR